MLPWLHNETEHLEKLADMVTLPMLIDCLTLGTVQGRGLWEPSFPAELVPT